MASHDERGQGQADASLRKTPKGIDPHSPTTTLLNSQGRRWFGKPISTLFFAVLAAACSFALIRFYGLFEEPPDNLQNWSLEFSTNTETWDSNTWPTNSHDQFLIGVGKADITGPVVEINLNGYADASQVGTGLRQRLYSRAFIVGSLTRPEDRFIYLVIDTQSGDTGIRYGILSGLEQLGPGYSMYGHDSLAVSGTHSHSGPGGWNNYLLPQLPSKGFSRQSHQAIVDGCLLSIRRAHESLQPGYLSLGKTKITSASINRSLFSYLANPEEERAKYNLAPDDDGTVDREMTMLKFQRASDGVNIGMLNWFPTHGTSLFGNNTVITGDNKGVAADLFEKKIRYQASESINFVAGFSQANMGDVSPNVLGAWCEDGTGSMCTLDKSTCEDGKSQKCHARGPHFEKDSNGFASCFEIGKRQFEGALRLYQSMDDKALRLKGNVVKSIHVFHDMAGFQFKLPDGRLAKTCPAALGYSFAAGTSDGPGAGEFTQHGSNASNTSPIWRMVSGFLKTPAQEQIDCQHPKPVLLDVGEAHRPYEWTPNIVDVQLFRAGDLVIIVSPGEATTMAGRRWKEAIAKHSQEIFGSEIGGMKPSVVIGGPSNTYAHYISTEEEYQYVYFMIVSRFMLGSLFANESRIQRYEGASTLYGPHTLNAYIHRSIELIPYLRAERTPGKPNVFDGPLPPDNTNRSLSLITGVLYDGRPWTKQFGDVLIDVKAPVFSPGQEVSATFVGANPRNNLRLEQTFAAVEYRVPETQTWRIVKDDSDWELIYHWRRVNKLFGTSEVEIVWEIDESTASGEYRLRYFGDAKSILGRVHEFSGTSQSFYVH